MTVQDLYIYPVKSLGGIRKERAVVFERGFEHDRRWMLVDEEGKFISQRSHAQLAVLQTRLTEHELIVSHRFNEYDQIVLPLVPSDEEDVIEVQVWNDRIKAVHIDRRIDEWFSEHLKKDCRFVFLPYWSERFVDSYYTSNQSLQVSFADAFPYLLIGQASLDDLNSRLTEPVPMNRFRPNIVVSGSNAFEEDTWKEIRIGEIRFRVSKPCARCIVTTIDQETSVKGTEPLATLAQYREVGNKVMFGQNLVALNKGVIHIGDEVEILDI